MSNSSTARFKKGQAVWEVGIYGREELQNPARLEITCYIRESVVLACGQKRLLVEKDGLPRGVEYRPDTRSVLAGSEKDAANRALEIAREDTDRQLGNLRLYLGQCEESGEERAVAMYKTMIAQHENPIFTVDRYESLRERVIQRWQASRMCQLH